MYLAFKYVVMALMLAEINFIGENLNVAMKFPVCENQVCKQVLEPRIGIGGALFTTNFMFSFTDSGRLCYIHKLKAFGNLDPLQENLMLSQSKSVIETNGAYVLASNWVVQLSVDVKQLQMDCPVTIQQRVFFDPSDGGKKKTLPVFFVKWGNWEDPKVEVCIDGRTKQLVHLRLEDDSLSHRPGIVKNWKELLQIPDGEFRSLAPDQRQKLIDRFAGITYARSQAK